MSFTLLENYQIPKNISSIFSQQNNQLLQQQKEQNNSISQKDSISLYPKFDQSVSHNSLLDNSYIKSLYVTKPTESMQGNFISLKSKSNISFSLENTRRCPKNLAKRQNPKKKKIYVKKDEHIDREEDFEPDFDYKSELPNMIDINKDNIVEEKQPALLPLDTVTDQQNIINENNDNNMQIEQQTTQNQTQGLNMIDNSTYYFPGNNLQNIQIDGIDGNNSNLISLQQIIKNQSLQIQTLQDQLHLEKQKSHESNNQQQQIKNNQSVCIDQYVSNKQINQNNNNTFQNIIGDQFEINSINVNIDPNNQTINIKNNNSCSLNSNEGLVIQLNNSIMDDEENILDSIPKISSMQNELKIQSFTQDFNNNNNINNQNNFIHHLTQSQDSLINTTNFTQTEQSTQQIAPQQQQNLRKRRKRMTKEQKQQIELEKQKLKEKKQNQEKYNTSHVPINMLNNLNKFLIKFYEKKVPCTCQGPQNSVRKTQKKKKFCEKKEACKACKEYQILQKTKKSQFKNLACFRELWSYQRIQIISEHFFLKNSCTHILNKNYRSENNRMALFTSLQSFLNGVRNPNKFWKISE